MSNFNSEKRLCHIVKRSDFDGYGFNLHAEKNRPGQYIGKIDTNSPAELAGLKQGDQIIEVNGVSIKSENHKQVVQRIKALSNEVRLLVIVGAPNHLITKSINNLDESNSIKLSSGKTEINQQNTSEFSSAHTLQVELGDANTDLNLKMTAAELRAKLAAKKQKGPKHEMLSLQKKYEIIQKL